MALKKWYTDKLQQEANKYDSRGEFAKNSKGAYLSAMRNDLLDQICAHMSRKCRKTYTYDELKIEASKYKTRSEFENKNPNMYSAALRRKIMNKICQHMINKHRRWSNDELKIEALKYATRNSFIKHNPSAYQIAHSRKIFEDICSHMPKHAGIGTKPHNLKWTEETVTKEASKYKNRSDFQKKSGSAYMAARKLKIVDEICRHMKLSQRTSASELNLFQYIRQKFPKAQTLHDRKVSIPNKPHIKGFDIDIYIPELRKGIEFDGTYWHAVIGLKRSRKNWPEEDLQNYSYIKDEYFKSKGIKILHIKEEDYKKDFKKCIDNIFQFLEET